jgi:large subunit ribosomal protein L19e
LIRAKAIKGTSRVRARARLEQRRKGRQKGQGKRMGTANARNPRKNRWMRTIRSQRKALKELREAGEIIDSEYRRYYLKAKGGSYRSIAHMRSQMTLEGVKLKEGDN